MYGVYGVPLILSAVWFSTLVIECVRMTSRWPCWRSKQRKGGHVGGVKYSFGDLTLFLCKFLLLFHYANMASGHMSEHNLYFVKETLRDVYLICRKSQYVWDYTCMYPHMGRAFTQSIMYLFLKSCPRTYFSSEDWLLFKVTSKITYWNTSNVRKKGVKVISGICLQRRKILFNGV